MLGDTETCASGGRIGSVLLIFKPPNQFSTFALWISLDAKVRNNLAENSLLFKSDLPESEVSRFCRSVETKACGVSDLGRSTTSASIEEIPWTTS